MSRPSTTITFACGCRKVIFRRQSRQADTEKDPLSSYSRLEKKCEFWCPTCDALPAAQKQAKASSLGQTTELPTSEDDLEELRRTVAAEMPSHLPGHEAGSRGGQVSELSKEERVNLRQRDERFFESLEQPLTTGQGPLVPLQGRGIRVLCPVEERFASEGVDATAHIRHVGLTAEDKVREEIWQQHLANNQARFQRWLEKRQKTISELRETKERFEVVATAAQDAQSEEQVTIRETQTDAVCAGYPQKSTSLGRDAGTSERELAKRNQVRRDEDELYGSG